MRENIKLERIYHRIFPNAGDVNNNGRGAKKNLENTRRGRREMKFCVIGQVEPAGSTERPESDGKEGRESYLARDQETRGKDTETGGGGGGGRC